VGFGVFGFLVDGLEQHGGGWSNLREVMRLPAWSYQLAGLFGNGGVFLLGSAVAAVASAKTAARSIVLMFNKFMVHR
jgi:hypothetical protein